MFYAHAWKVRKIQMIIVNVIFAVLGAYVGVADHIPALHIQRILSLHSRDVKSHKGNLQIQMRNTF